MEERIRLGLQETSKHIQDVGARIGNTEDLGELMNLWDALQTDWKALGIYINLEKTRQGK